MKKFLLVKIFLILMITFIGINVFMHFDFNIKESKTYKLLKEYKDNYTFKYLEGNNVNSDKTEILQYINKDYSLNITIQSDDNRIKTVFEKIQELGKETTHTKGKNSDEEEFYDNKYTFDMTVDSETGWYAYDNILQTYYNHIENLKYYNKGFIIIDGKICTYEKFDFGNEGYNKHIYDGDKLIRIDFHQESEYLGQKVKTDLYAYGIELYKGENEEVIGVMKEKFNNTANN